MLSKKEIIYVAMSGGVDSSVAAALLKEEGYHVVGVFFKPWTPSNGLSFCNWQEDRMDAMRVAVSLGIDFKTWDFSKEYQSGVAEYMIDSYKKGDTPNPDVMCNKEIKFGLFLKKALLEGADMIATGHYAIVKRKAQSVELIKAKDRKKDQTYFLWTLTQEQLTRSVFPIGNYTKPEVRKLAKKFKLPNHSKKDSQGVCFVGDLDMHDFLATYIEPKKGDIYFEDKIVGQHDGASYYTIGQRHGLDIKTGGGPYFVKEKDINKNVIKVTNNIDDIKISKFYISSTNWISGDEKLPLKSSIQIRYHGDEVASEVTDEGGRLLVRTEKPLISLALGQSVVMYNGREVLGGGVVSGQ